MSDNIRKIRPHLLFILLTICSQNIFSQIYYPGKPMGSCYDNNIGVKFINIQRPPHALKNNFTQESDQVSGYKSDRFADNVLVSFKPESDGCWDTLSNGTCLWRLGLYSLEATSIGLIFEKYRLLPGVKILVYCPSMNEVLGAFTFRNNNSDNLLALAPLNGDSLIIELQILKGQSDFGELEVGQAGLGYPYQCIEKSTNDKWYQRSDSCEIDINCIIDTNIQRQKRSVCRIVYNSNSRCTGTLINNTSVDGRPLVLTANHCIDTSRSARRAVFFFDYESPYCNGPDGKSKSISGSKILATSKELDFTLLEMNEKPPADYYPLYAGWSNSTVPFTGSYTIHHPEGDVKKIAISKDMAQPIWSSPKEYWLVSKYETGTTQKGSSGAALFDTAGHVRGILSEGGLTCGYYIFDKYTKIDKAWNYYSDSTAQLEYWLDPLKLGTDTMENFMPNDPFLSYSEELSNIDTNQSFSVLKETSGWGYLTGHNSQMTDEYAERFYRNGSKYIYALKVDVAKANALIDTSMIVFKVWAGGEVPGKVLFEKQMLLFELVEGEENMIRLDTSLFVDQEFYVGYKIFYTSPSDTFAVKSYGTAIPGSVNTALVRKNGNWQQISENGNSISTSLSVKPIVFNYPISDRKIPGEFPKREITLYPNPTNDELQVLFKEKQEGTIFYAVYDMKGIEMLKGLYQSPEPNFSINIDILNQGMYILEVSFPEGVYRKKFVKLP
jgi:lysyl endopeptidase